MGLHCAGSLCVQASFEFKTRKTYGAGKTTAAPSVTPRSPKGVCPRPDRRRPRLCQRQLSTSLRTMRSGRLRGLPSRAKQAHQQACQQQCKGGYQGGPPTGLPTAVPPSSTANSSTTKQHHQDGQEACQAGLPSRRTARHRRRMRCRSNSHRRTQKYCRASAEQPNSCRARSWGPLPSCCPWVPSRLPSCCPWVLDNIFRICGNHLGGPNNPTG